MLLEMTINYNYAVVGKELQYCRATNYVPSSNENMNDKNMYGITMCNVLQYEVVTMQKNIFIVSYDDILNKTHLA